MIHGMHTEYLANHRAYAGQLLMRPQATIWLLAELTMEYAMNPLWELIGRMKGQGSACCMVFVDFHNKQWWMFGYCQCSHSSQAHASRCIVVRVCGETCCWVCCVNYAPAHACGVCCDLDSGQCAMNWIHLRCT